ncbi:MULTISPECIES: AsmA family protein [unclassified Agarivorans]|uniref:AsmA family protein n=1 Tax=unclassified Agarivorans TaxID=2636026 RepID=UPI003D7D651D
MKKLLYGFIAIVVLLLVVVVIAVSLVDTNDVKQLIVSKTKEATGRELVIDGDLSWRFFPSIGFQLGSLHLLDHPNFGQGETLSIDGAEMSVALMPLFSKTIDLGEISLSGLSFRYQTNADGSSNLDDLTKTGDAASQTEPSVSQAPSEQVATEAASPWNISLSGLVIKDANIELIDLKTNKTQKVGPIDFKLEGLELGKDNRFELTSQYSDGELSLIQQAHGILFVTKDFSSLSVKDLDNNLEINGDAIPNGKMNIQSNLNLEYLVSQKIAELSSLNVDIDGKTQLSGSSRLQLSDAIPSLSFNLMIPLLDTSAFISPSQDAQQTDAVKTSPEQTPGTEQEPDLSALKTINLDGRLTITKLQHQKLHLENIKQHLVIKSGVLSLKQLSADLYGGKLDSSALVNGNEKQASYSMSAKLSGVKAQPLLSDAANFEFVAGKLDVDLNLKGKGLTSMAVKQRISGPINATFSDGAIYGINIPQMIRAATVSLKGGDKQQAQQEQKTDFSELVIHTKLGQSLASVTKAQMVSPLLRVDGKGKTHLVNESLDFSFITKVVASLEGQGASNDLAGLDIPLKISGSWTQPKVQLDMKKLLEGQAKEALNKELNKALGGKEGNKKLLDSLGSFFK